MNRTRRYAALISLPLALTSAACASESNTADDGSNDSNVVAAKNSCSSTGAFDSAYKHYKSALAKAKAHATQCIDGKDGNGQWGVFREASAAVQLCPAFAATFKSSLEAYQVRDQLSGSLGLALITGAVDPKSLQGVSKALAAGVTFYRPTAGEPNYGTLDRVVFGPGGEGQVLRYEPTSSSNDEVRAWQGSPFVYKVGATNTRSVAGKSTNVLDLNIQGGGFEDFGQDASKSFIAADLSLNVGGAAVGEQGQRLLPVRAKECGVTVPR